MSPVFTPLPSLSDNYIWLAAQHGRALCIDPGEAAPVLDCLRRHALTLDQIWITHHHRDHTGGIAALKDAFPECRVYGGADIAEADIVLREGSRTAWRDVCAEVWHTPGHTEGHLVYLVRLPDDGRLHVFTGDTLFAAGCGRVFPPCTAQSLHRSLQRLAALPSDTLLYPAHEYTAVNLAFVRHIEPDNPDLPAAAGRALRPPTLPVTLENERRTNPFLRTTLPHIRRRTAELSGRSLPDDAAVFAALRELKNGFQAA